MSSQQQSLLRHPQHRQQRSKRRAGARKFGRNLLRLLEDVVGHLADFGIARFHFVAQANR